MNKITIDIRTCPRCLGQHEQLVFEQLANSNRDVSHFAICPATRQPVTMLVELTRTDARQNQRIKEDRGQ